MSDGPHRSLPMRRHWKALAERAAKAAYAPDDVCESLPYALKKDILEGPVREVREIMNAATLFPSMRVEQLNALRKDYQSATSARLIDCAVVASADGLKGDAGSEAAVKNALEGTMRDALRGIEEHYLREAGSRRAGYVRGRLDAARHRTDCGAIARDLHSTNTPPVERSGPLRRRSGIDEGPPL